MERRRALRFEFELPLVVHWTNDSVPHEAVTYSKDVSSKGIYFFLADRVQNGASIEIAMTLPDEITLAGNVRVVFHGRIQRCELKAGEGGNAGVAVSLEKYEFLQGNGDVA